MTQSPKLLATLSRHACGDVGQIEGPRDEVLNQVQERARRARKPFHVNLRGFDNNFYLTDEVQNYIAMPGGDMQKILPLDPQNESQNMRLSDKAD